MLLCLEVRDFVIVDSLGLDFASGLTVLTGETGAGKSILIDALSVALGARSESGWVRQGQERAEVAATFLPEDTLTVLVEDAQTDEWVELSIEDWLRAEGFDHEESTLLLKRQIDRQGRSRAWINGRSATAQQLKVLGEALLTIHGQHAHQSLLKAPHQRALLDRFGQLENLARDVLGAWEGWQDAEKALVVFETELAALLEKSARLNRECEELSAVAMTAEDWLQLQQDHARLAHAAFLLEGAERIVEGLSEGEVPALSLLHQIQSTLADLVLIDDTLTPTVDLLQGAVIALEEVGADVRRYANRVELDPERLHALDQKIQSVLTVARRYRLAPEEMWDRLQAVLLALSDLNTALSKEALIEARDQAKARYDGLATTLSAARQKAKEGIEQDVTQSIRALALGEGSFHAVLTPLPAGSRHGNESVVFSWSQYPGQAPTPIAKTASGGELSRMSLAIQTALTRVSDVPTMIFDEVDTGIGGGVAEIVGRLLHRVAEGAQVMCVTHLPQVAAWADHHLSVQKTRDAQGMPQSSIQVLDEAAQVEEIARMLGGVTLTDTTRAHARELLKNKSIKRA